MARETGYIEYDGLEGQIRTGCMNTPEQKSEYCSLHKPRACDPNISHHSEETVPEPQASSGGVIQLLLEKKLRGVPPTIRYSCLSQSFMTTRGTQYKLTHIIELPSLLALTGSETPNFLHSPLRYFWEL